jgi:hypothetical protein
MAAMGQNWVEMKMKRVETGWFYAAPAVLNSNINIKSYEKCYSEVHG